MRARFLLLALAAGMLSGQQNGEAVSLYRQHRLVSPNGAYALAGVAGRSELLLEDERTRERTRVMGITVETMTVAWSPDSAAFLVNDRYASDVECAYIYDTKTLERVDLGRLVENSIIGQEPKAARFLWDINTGIHSYFDAMRWLDAQHVELRLFGHTNGSPDAIPGECFDLRYRISRDGVVEKLSEHSAPIGVSECAG